ncbi:hypothetical protein ACFL4P_00830 [Gemmatimonadota bacterium]
MGSSGSKKGENKPEDQARKPSPGRAGKSQAEEVVSQRMIYEDDLRKACGKRALEMAEQHKWMALRRKIPISQWVERNFEMLQSKTEKKKFRKELEEYHRIFSGEAEELNLELDMERNYYSEAVELLSNARHPDALEEKERRSLTELMIVADYKDARMGIQIVKSIL